MRRIARTRQWGLAIALVAPLLALAGCRDRARPVAAPRPPTRQTDSKPPPAPAETTPATALPPTGGSPKFSADPPPGGAATARGNPTDTPSKEASSMDATDPATSPTSAATASDAPGPGRPMADYPIRERWWVAGAVRPARIAWRLGVGDLPIDQAWDAYLQTLTARLDGDQDGVVHWSEVLGDTDIRRGLYANPPVPNDQSAYQFEQQYDIDRDQTADAAELTRYLLSASGLTSPVTVQADIGHGKLQDLEQTLLGHLDRNRNGRLDKDECQSLADRLRQLDADGDHALTALEIREITGTGAESDGGGMYDEKVVLRLHRRSHAGDVIYWLDQIYGAGASGEGGVTTAAQRAALDQPMTLDDVNDPSDWAADLGITVGFSDHGAPVVNILDLDPGDPAAAVAPDQSPSGPWVCDVGGMEMRIEVHDGLSAWLERLTSDDPFAKWDTNKDGKLTEEEVAKAETGAVLPSADTLGGGLDREAFAAWVQRLANTRRSTVRIVVEPSRDVWIGLDQNADGTLGERELEQAATWVRQRDGDGDGVVAVGELPYGLVVRVERPAPRPAAGRGPNGIVAERPLPPSVSDEAPAWFSAMDLNRDGEISAREFPGPPETFRTLDTDQDGYLERSEIPETPTPDPLSSSPAPSNDRIGSDAT